MMAKAMRGDPSCLATPRLEIRRLTIADITEEYVRGLNDPEVNRYMEVRRRFQTYESVKRYVERHLHCSSAILFALYAKPDLRLIGTVRLHDISDYHFTAGIGICLFAKDYWGKGYGVEALTRVTEFAFQERGLHYLEALVYQDNQASQKLFLKAGFQVIAVVPNKYRFGERFASVVIFGLINADFDEKCFKTDRSDTKR